MRKSEAPEKDFSTEEEPITEEALIADVNARAVEHLMKEIEEIDKEMAVRRATFAKEAEERTNRIAAIKNAAARMLGVSLEKDKQSEFEAEIHELELKKSALLHKLDEREKLIRRGEKLDEINFAE